MNKKNRISHMKYIRNHMGYSSNFYCTVYIIKITLHTLSYLSSFRINNGVGEALAGHRPTDYKRWKDEKKPYTVNIHTL